VLTLPQLQAAADALAAAAGASRVGAGGYMAVQQAADVMLALSAQGEFVGAWQAGQLALDTVDMLSLVCCWPHATPF
jgi:hypothetical protein